MGLSVIATRAGIEMGKKREKEKKEREKGKEREKTELCRRENRKTAEKKRKE